MRAASLAAGIVLAVCLAVPAVSGPIEHSDTKAHAAATSPKKRAIQQTKQPTWEECYAMSRQRGFDHDIDEWFQSIADCQEGKIPL
jgi:hypothetical protein